jgi:hypothetical protein
MLTLLAPEALQNELQNVAGGVAALLALIVKVLQTSCLSPAWMAGSHQGGVRFESG